MAAVGSKKQEFSAGPWMITSVKGHILRSQCETKGSCSPEGNLCTVCKFSNSLELSVLPEMVFGDNLLRLYHTESDCGVEFNTLDALRAVNKDPPSDIKVAAADKWLKSREDQTELSDSVPQFDWTFTTNYSGSLLRKGNSAGIKVEETEERIDLEALKVKERIFFYDELVLFEDELADNGVALLNVKIRVMASGFLVLLRFFLRVDGVLVHINDTRLYHRAGSEYLIRDFCTKRAKLSEVQIPPHLLVDPNALAEHIPTTEHTVHKLTLPSGPLVPTGPPVHKSEHV